MKKLKGRPSKYSAETIQRIYELYDTTEKGAGLIGVELGIPRNTVYWYLMKRKKAQRIENPDANEQN